MKTRAKVVYLSETVEGKKHDKKARRWKQNQLSEKREFDARYRMRKAISRKVCWRNSPKKVRGHELTQIDKFLNKMISRVRMVVENVISGVKRCRIVKDELRLTKEHISDVVMEIACGLHNLRVTFRQPIQTIDITNVEELSYFK